MARVFSLVYIAGITFQCFMHYRLMGYHDSIIFWWLLNFGVASLIWDGYKVKKQKYSVAKVLKPTDDVIEAHMFLVLNSLERLM